MRFKSNSYIKLLTATVFLAGTPFAHIAAAADDAEQGAVIAYSCLGCHGIDGYRNAYPSYRVPRLGGQKPAYIKSALLAYRNGQRLHPTMVAQGSSLSDNDISDVVAWLGSKETAQDQASAESVSGIEAAGACVECHGANGANVLPAPPTLAGQQKDYLQKALHDYQSGNRPGTVMSAFSAALSAADIDAISSYYAAQKGLVTLSADD